MPMKLWESPAFLTGSTAIVGHRDFSLRIGIFSDGFMPLSKPAMLESNTKMVSPLTFRMWTLEHGRSELGKVVA